MLGVRVVLGLSLLLLWGNLAAGAWADEVSDPGQVNRRCLTVNIETAGCDAWLILDGGSARQGKSRGGVSSTPRVCAYQGRSIECETALGSWSSYAGAWCRLLPVQPPPEAAVWVGRSGGAAYSCTRAGFDGLPDPWGAVLRWLPSAPEVPDPEELARRLLAGIDFESPELGIHPRGDTLERMSLVGWNMWLWAAPTSELQWGPVTDSTSEGGVSVTLTATVSQMVWEMGNGDSVTCGRGTKWTLSATSGRNVKSPNCGYVYAEDGRYTVTGTSYWDVDWSGGGQSGSLPFTLSRDVEVIVGELQSVRR